ncbi:MAG TPA: bile acid:sodium symporter family protein [Bacteroidales bacterium]|nr:bile acid:sodium symporter family protein [Bacteroidales bacterium]
MKMYLALTILFAIVEVIILATGNGGNPASGFVLFAMFYALAFTVQKTDKLKGLSFTCQIFAFVSFTLYFPQLFTNWGFDTNKLIVPSIQVIMFGMGTKLSIADFVKELSQPFKVIMGTIMVYVLMPLAAFLIIKVYNFPPEVAAGIILLGACPGGAASNIMTYLAKGNLALSMTVTTLTTLLSPIVTPLMMQMFAGELIQVDVVDMMISIVNIIFIPVFAGIVINKILYGNLEWAKKNVNIALMGVLTFIAGFGLLFVSFPDVIKALQTGLILVAWSITIVSIVMIYIRRTNGPTNWMDKVLPKVSLTAIMIYIVVVAAHNKATLLSIGPALFVATILHNLLGYASTLAASKALGFSDRDTRALVMEVGTKNAGLAVGLAYDVLKSTAAALAPLIFGTWMNISASSLATFWSTREPKPERVKAKKAA